MSWLERLQEVLDFQIFELGGNPITVLTKPEPEVRFLELGDSSLNFELLVWSDQPPPYYRLRSELNYAIDAAFRAKGIVIPFPQRDLHLKTPSPAELTRAFSK